MNLNSEYIRHMVALHQLATTAVDQDVALPVVTNMEDHAEYSEAAGKFCEPEIPLAPAVNETIDNMQDSDISKQVSLQSDELVDGLGQIFNRYEIAMGSMNIEHNEQDHRRYFDGFIQAQRTRPT